MRRGRKQFSHFIVHLLDTHSAAQLRKSSLFLARLLLVPKRDCFYFCIQQRSLPKTHQLCGQVCVFEGSDVSDFSFQQQANRTFQVRLAKSSASRPRNGLKWREYRKKPRPPWYGSATNGDACSHLFYITTGRTQQCRKFKLKRFCTDFDGISNHFHLPTCQRFPFSVLVRGAASGKKANPSGSLFFSPMSRIFTCIFSPSCTSSKRARGSVVSSSSFCSKWVACEVEIFPPGSERKCVSRYARTTHQAYTSSRSMSFYDSTTMAFFFFLVYLVVALLGRSRFPGDCTV